MKIPDKVLELFNNLDERSRNLALVGALIFILILDFFIIMRPQLRGLAKISPKIKTLANDLKTTKNDMKRVGQYQKEVESFRNKVDVARARIIAKEELPVILERISLIANESDVKINQIMPDVQDQKKLLATEDLIYYSLPIIIEARSGYHNFGRFLGKIEQNEVLLKVSTFNVSSVGDSHISDIRITLKAVVFEKNETGVKP